MFSGNANKNGPQEPTFQEVKALVKSFGNKAATLSSYGESRPK